MERNQSLGRNFHTEIDAPHPFVSSIQTVSSISLDRVVFPSRPHNFPVIAVYLLGASINDCRFCHTNERPNGGRQQLSALLPPSSSEPVSDSFKAAARNAFPQLYSLPSHIAPWVWLHYLTRPRNLSQLCQVASSPRRFVASLKLCLGLRIAAGRTSGRAWDFSWQFVESELPGKKESMECRAVGE